MLVTLLHPLYSTLEIFQWQPGKWGSRLFLSVIRMKEIFSTLQHSFAFSQKQIEFCLLSWNTLLPKLYTLMQKLGCLNNMILSDLSCCPGVVTQCLLQTEGRAAKALAGWFSQLSLRHWRIATASSFHRLGFFQVCVLKVLFSSTAVGTCYQHRQTVRGCVSKVFL